jgi:hypothetical protein
VRPDIEAVRRLARFEIEAHGARDLCGYALQCCDYIEEVERERERAADIAVRDIDAVKLAAFAREKALMLERDKANAECEARAMQFEELILKSNAFIEERDEARAQRDDLQIAVRTAYAEMRRLATCDIAWPGYMRAADLLEAVLRAADGREKP